jgi:hypothetical protein
LPLFKMFITCGKIKNQLIYSYDARWIWI